tara:strand:+ start:381141 stop:382358 length:1218 start_codon:yes stop_codon:yes gene_type:complete
MLHSTFIAPFKSLTLCVVYLAAFIAVAGMTGVYLYMVFDYATMGMWAVMEHFIVRALFVSMLIMPFCLWLGTVISFKPFMIITSLVQIIASLAFCYIGLDGDNWLLTLLFSISVAVFWSVFHLMMSNLVTDKNAGNEVCMADAGVTVGVLIGSLLGGVSLTMGLGGLAFIVGSIMVVLGTFILYLSMGQSIKKAQMNLSFFGENEGFNLQTLRAKKKNIFSTFYEGSFQTIANYLVPVWLHLMAVSAMGVGFLSAAQIALKIIVSPLVGHFTNKSALAELSSDDDLDIGLSLKAVGWLPWLFLQTPLLYMFSSLFWTAGQHFYSMGMASRWYRKRSICNLALREFSLGFGRLATTLVALPLLYWSLHSYIVFSVVLSVSMVLTTKLARSSMREGGLALTSRFRRA